MDNYLKLILLLIVVLISYYLAYIYSANRGIPIVGGAIKVMDSIFGVYKNKITDKFMDIVSKKDKVVETIDDIKYKMEYVPSSGNVMKLGHHIGQRKLFLSEVQFLTKLKHVKYCIYAGAAPKHTALYLSQLFPNIKLILVDPNKFNIVIPNNKTHRFTKHNEIVHLKSGYPAECNTMYDKNYVESIENTNYKIYVIEDYMTSKLSHILEKLKGERCFISDIRSNIYEEQTPTDFDIIWNNCMVYNWINILQPARSMIKYRPLYDEKNIRISTDSKILEDFTEAKKYGLDFLQNIKDGITFYSKSTIYIQAWAGKSSSEVRLWVDRKDINNLVKYDNEIMEQKSFYFNLIDRMWVNHHNENTNKQLHFCNCNDCSLENKIWEDYGYNGKEIFSAVKHLGEITNRQLSKVHKFDYYKLFGKEDIKKRMDLYNKLGVKKVSNYGFQRGNLGKV